MYAVSHQHCPFALYFWKNIKGQVCWDTQQPGDRSTMRQYSVFVISKPSLSLYFYYILPLLTCIWKTIVHPKKKTIDKKFMKPNVEKNSPICGNCNFNWMHPKLVPKISITPDNSTIWYVEHKTHFPHDQQITFLKNIIFF